MVKCVAPIKYDMTDGTVAMGCIGQLPMDVKLRLVEMLEPPEQRRFSVSANHGRLLWADGAI